MVLVLSVLEGIETFSYLLFECEPKFIHRTKLPLIHQIGYYCKWYTSLGAKEVVWFKTCSKIQYSSVLRLFQRTCARVWFVPSLRRGIGLFAAITVVSPSCLFLAKYLGISSWQGARRCWEKAPWEPRGFQEWAQLCRQDLLPADADWKMCGVSTAGPCHLCRL